ncbi:protein kinase [candidate division CSSED10-310 bacterium]|uniref:Protein kinase n=1 Tax=candidate division CSSED10-310 bacterium TaxID=2855610 RepID=A0ABV6YYS5_UNCC1
MVLPGESPETMLTWQQKFPQLLQQTRYTILGQIGEGGMACVFKVQDTELDDIVALKILKTETLRAYNSLDRFKREIKLARKITHRNICRVYHFSKFGNFPYIIMEYLDGKSLAYFIEQKDLYSDGKKLSLLIKILQGLEAAHEEKVVHRDLKPNNIVVIRKDLPVITDFGLALNYDQKSATTKHSIYGTAAYMAPEQITGAEVDHRADIYSFGLIFYELLTGTYPFNDSNPFTLLINHVKDIPPPPRHYKPSLDVRIEAIVMKCLAKNPADRFQSVSDIITDVMKTFPEKEIETDKPIRKKVLIVDDEVFIRKILIRMFESLGFDVICGQNGREAISKALDEKPDLIFMDIMMPKMDGIEASEILLSTQKTKDIPIIILTCKEDKDYMIYSRSIGIRDYLIKPINLNTLSTRIHYWLEPNKSI